MKKGGRGSIHLVNTLPAAHPETGEDGSVQIVL